MLIISEDSEYRESGSSVINVTCSGYQYFSMLAKLACSSSKINEWSRIGMHSSSLHMHKRYWIIIAEIRVCVHVLIYISNNERFLALWIFVTVKYRFLYLLKRFANEYFHKGDTLWRLELEFDFSFLCLLFCNRNTKTTRPKYSRVVWNILKFYYIMIALMKFKTNLK